jgi:3-oxoisoapionate decarboxylase
VTATALGIGSFAYAWAAGIAGHMPPRPMTIRDLILRAEAYGVHLAQIGDNLPLHTLSESDLAALASEAAARGVAIEVGTGGILIDHLCHYLDIALRFDSPILRVVVDTADHHPAPDEVIACLGEARPLFESAGVVLAIENHDRFRTRTLREIIETVGSPNVGICLDTVNSMGAGEGLETVVACLGPYVVNLHIKDFVVRRHSHMLGFEVLGAPAGKGSLDIPWLIGELDNYDRKYSVILELWPPPEENLAATIVKEDQWVKDSLAYLRRLIAN